MYKFIVPILLFFMISCSSDDTGSILIDYPITYKLSKVESLGISSYYYTDTIIYKTNNDLTDSLEAQRNAVVSTTLFNGDTTLNSFIINELTFLDEQTVSIRGRLGESMEKYTEISGLGSTTLSDGQAVGFKINPDLGQLISCYTQTSERRVDTLYPGEFLASLDTLYTQDSLLQFQLNITEASTTKNSFCEDFNELMHVTEFANFMQLNNNDRIISHRTDIIFTRSQQ